MQPFDLQTQLALKNLLFFLQFIEFQGADSILKVDFALSSRPHLHRAYVVTVCNQIWLAVSNTRAVEATKLWVFSLFSKSKNFLTKIGKTKKRAKKW